MAEFRSRPHHAIAAGLAAALITTSAFAARLDTPSVEVLPDNRGAAADVRSSIDVNAPPAVVWSIMIDCAQAPKLMSSIKSCRVLDSDPAGHWDMREQIAKTPVLPDTRTVMRTDFDAPHWVRFHRVSGAFKVLEGEWRLEPLDGGQHTRVFYNCRVSAPIVAPGFMVRAALRGSIPKMLTNLREASQAASAAEARVASNGAATP